MIAPKASSTSSHPTCSPASPSARRRRRRSPRARRASRRRRRSRAPIRSRRSSPASRRARRPHRQRRQVGKWKAVQPVGPSSYSATPIRRPGKSKPGLTSLPRWFSRKTRRFPPAQAPCRGSPFVKNTAPRLWSHVCGSGCEAAWDLIIARARVVESVLRSGLPARVVVRLVCDIRTNRAPPDGTTARRRR